MANCTADLCGDDPIYTTPLTPAPLPNPDDCGGGGGGEGHKYTFSATGTGWNVKEDGRVIFNYTDKNTDTTYTWQATTEGWLVKDNTGKVVFNYTDKSGENTTYNFEQTDDCGIKVTDNTGKVVFEYKNTCAGTTYTYEQNGVDFKVTNDKTGQVVFNYKGTVDTNTTYTYENYKDGFKVTDSEGVVAYIYDPELGKMSDGSYGIDTLLTTVIKGHTTISMGQIIGFTPADLVVGETLVYDGVGSVGVITKDNGDGTYEVTTMTISPGTRQGVRLGSVENEADLPKTCADAEAMGWQTPQLGDFAYVTKGGQGDEISEYVITSDTDCNLTWTFSHSFNAGDYQSQSTTSMAGMILTGGAVQGTFGTPIDPKTLIRGVMRNGVLLTPDAQGKVNVVVDDSHIIVNALPTTGIVDKAEYIVIDANQKVTSTWVHDATGWYQTYAAVTQVKAHQVVTALPTTAIEENVEYVVVDTNNKVTGTWVYDPAKGWLQTEVLDKPAHIVVKDLPTTDIDDEAEYIVVDDLTDPVGTFNATYVHTDSGWVKTAEAAKAQAAHIAVTALPTTNINENAEYLVMTDLTDPTTLTGTWVRVKGNWVQTEKIDDSGYHIVKDLPTSDIDDKNIYIVVEDLANPDTSFLGQYAYDKATSKWVDMTPQVSNIYYNINRDGQELESVFATLPGGLTFKVGQYITFNKKSGTMEMDNEGGVEVKPNRRVEGTVVMQYNGTPHGVMPDINYTIVVKETGDIITSFNPLSATGYHGSASQTFQYSNETNAPVHIAVKVYTITGDKQTWDADHCTFSVKEIGRIVDPVAYLDNGGNAQEMPVGSLLNYFGTKAPDHYLVADGKEYAIGTYPALEAFILENFGTVNHFGGNGTTTWAVPDLQGEFLRAAGDSGREFIAYGTQKVSVGAGGAVGDHQDPTYHPSVFMYSNNSATSAIHVGTWDSATNTIVNWDSQIKKMSQFHDQGYSRTNTRDQVVGGTSRPTNTSVLVCIKCEMTPRVIVDQGTYKASVKVNMPANLTTFTKAAFVPDSGEDDTSMIDYTANAFKIPVNGYYVLGLQFAEVGGSQKNSQLGYCVTHNGVDNHVDWSSASLNNTALLKLEAGDLVSVKHSAQDVAKSNVRFNIALVNTVTDHKVAELMLKPNLWTAGVEQSFGDGVYGKRWTGTYSAAANAQATVTLFPKGSTPIHIINQGGEVEYRANQTMTLGGAWSTNYSVGIDNMLGAGNPCNLGIYTPNARTNCKYDVWLLYTK